MGWLIALVVLGALAVLPLGVGVRYNWEGLYLWIKAGPLRITVLPQKKKKAEKAPKKAESPSATRKKAPPEKPQPEKKGGSLRDFLPLLKLGLELLGQLRRKLRVNRLELEILLAQEDPCDLAVTYGRTCAAIAALLPQLERCFVIRKRHIWVGCDFEADQALLYGRLELTISLGNLVTLAVIYGIRALNAYLKINKTRKGGATS